MEMPCRSLEATSCPGCRLSGDDFTPDDSFWKLPPDAGDIILRTKAFMASASWQSCHVYFPKAVAKIRLSVGLPAGDHD